MFTGVGNGTACEILLQNFVYEVPENRCHPKPCSIGPYYQPSVPVDKQFYAIAAFVFYPLALKVERDDGSFMPYEMRASALEYCGKVGGLNIPISETFLQERHTTFMHTINGNYWCHQQIRWCTAYLRQYNIDH